MDDLERHVRARYLDKLTDHTWREHEAMLDYGIRALPIFIAAFEEEKDPELRALLTRIIWQFRDEAALPALTAALRDSHANTWRDALDGFVTLGGDRVLAVLKAERAAIALDASASEKLEWIDEAITQIANGTLSHPK